MSVETEDRMSQLQDRAPEVREVLIPEEPNRDAPPEMVERTLVDMYKEGKVDIEKGLRNWRVWYLMGSAEMRRRFDRSKLGPVWIAISTGVMVLSIAFIWSALWGSSVSTILPFIALGLVSWQFLSSVITDATLGFPSYSGYFANQYMAPSNVIFALVYKNLITYLINLPVPILVCIVFGVPFGWQTFLAIPGILLQIYVLFFAGYSVAIFCTRFRDVIQVTHSVLQLGFFLTPILWKPDLLSANVSAFVLFNPLASLIAIVRDPMLGMAPSASSWLVSLGCAAVLTITAIPLIGRAHRRIVYWL